MTRTIDARSIGFGGGLGPIKTHELLDEHWFAIAHVGSCFSISALAPADCPEGIGND